DPTVPTSVEQTLLVAGEIDRLMSLERPGVVAGADDGIRAIGLALAGRRDEARAAIVGMRKQSRIPLFLDWIEYLLAWVERRPDEMLVRMSGFGGVKIQEDPEAIFQEGWMLCDVGDHERALPRLERAVAKGYFVSGTLARWPQFDPLRGHPAFQAVVEAAEAGRQRALAAFREAGGTRLLGA